jgi:hypothetical protein
MVWIVGHTIFGCPLTAGYRSEATWIVTAVLSDCGRDIC